MTDVINKTGNNAGDMTGSGAGFEKGTDIATGDVTDIVTESICLRMESAVMDAGDILRFRVSKIATVAGTDPADENPHTNLDREMDEHLAKALPAALGLDEPVAWISEESSIDESRFDTRFAFIVDPLDGTRNVLKGRREAAVSAALWERDCGIVWGAIFNPFTCELFSARAGFGAFRNGEPIHVTSMADMKRSMFLVSVHESVKGMLCDVDCSINVKPVGSIAYKMALVAAGRAEGTFTINPRHDWDIAAGMLIVAEAGGRVTDSYGREVSVNTPSLLQNGVAVSNGALHPDVLNICNEVRRRLATGTVRPA